MSDQFGFYRPTDRQELYRHGQRLDALERKLNASVSGRPKPAPAGGGPHTATIVVASSVATDAEKLNADYVCDGTDDHVEINAARQYVRDNAYEGGSVCLTGGDFYLGAPLTTFEGYINLFGQGAGATLIEYVGAPFSGSIVGTQGGFIRDLWIMDGSFSTAVTGLSLGGGKASGLKFYTYGTAIAVTGQEATIENIENYVTGIAIKVATSVGRVDIGSVFFDNYEPAYPAIYLDSGANRVRIHDCYFSTSNGGAIWMADDAVDNMIRDCQFWTHYSSTVDQAVRLDGQRNSIIGCDFRDTSVGGTHPRGILLPATAVDNVAANNVFHGFAGSEISDLGAGSVTAPNIIF